MDYRRLGDSGLKVSEIGLGCNNFGMRIDQTATDAVIDAAIEHGVTFLDTADVNGGRGKSEEMIGHALKGKRQQVVLATKFAMPMGDAPDKRGGSRRYIMQAVEASLTRLQTDYIDLYQMHRPDPDTPIEETLSALDDLVTQGKVRYIGNSNYAGWQIADAEWTARTEHLNRFVSLQMQYSLVVRELEREHIPVCREFGMGVLPWSPLAAGFLTGKYTRSSPMPAGTRLTKWKDRFGRFANERGWRTIDALGVVAKEKGTTHSAVALAWLLTRPQVSSVIFGARSLEQLDDNLKAAELKLSPEDVKRLDDASAFEVGYPYDFMGGVQKRW